MPVDLNTLFQNVSKLDDSAQFHAHAADDLRQGSGLHGLKKLSSAARSAENQAAVQAFTAAVAAHPAYAALLAQVRAPLDALIQTGGPLTAGVIRRTIQDLQHLNMTAASAVGAELARREQIPAGHGSSFALFCLAHDLPLDTAAAKAEAVKEYLLTEVCTKNEFVLSRLPDAGEDKNAAARGLMLRLHGPLEGRDGFFARELDRQLAGGLDTFSFRAFERAFADACADDMDLIRFLSREDLEAVIAEDKPGDIMAALHEARDVTGADGLGRICNMLIVRSGSLATREERAAEIVGSLLEGMGTRVAGFVMEQHGLPKAFAAAVGHHPIVEMKAREALGQGPALPQGRDIFEALRHAVEDFVEENLPLLQEFAIMANDPPVDLDPPLTVETMPRYINAMLSGDELLEPLLHDNTPLDADFLDRLFELSVSVDSASHAVEGDFGARDRNAVLENAVTMLMARRGVPQQMLPEMVSRAAAKFGRLASELNSVSFAMQSGRFGMDGVMMSSRLLSMAGALQIFGQQLILSMSDEQRSGMRLDMFNTPVQGADVEELRRRGQDFTERTFQTEIPLDRISDLVRDFIDEGGVRLPAMDPAVAAGLDDAAAGVLAADNLSMMEAVLSTLIPDTDGGFVPHTGEFRAFMAELLASRPELSAVDADTVNLASMSGAVRQAATDVVQAASEAGRAVDPAAVRAAAEHALTREMERLAATAAAVDALPDRDLKDGVLVGFDDEEKAVIKEAAQLFGIRDAGVLSAMASVARTPDFIRGLLGAATPGATPQQMLEQAQTLVEKYRSMMRRLPNDFEGAENAMAAMVALGVTHLSRHEADNLAANMRSAVTDRAAGSLLWLLGRNLAPRNEGTTVAVFEMLNVLRGEVEADSQGVSARGVRYYNTPVTHPSELPGGPNGVMMGLLALGSHGAVPDYFFALSRHEPPLTRQQWDALATLLSPLMESAKSSPRSDLIREWVGSSAEEILAAMQAGDGPLSMEKLWEIFTGGFLGPMPSDVKGMDAVARMIDHIDHAYQKRVKAIAPQIDPGERAWMLNNCSGLGVPPRKILELLNPGTSLSLADIRMSMEMSSMRDLNEDNAYRLGRDFVRRSRTSTMTFVLADGTAMSVHPVRIQDDSATVDHPVLRPILDFWEGMSHSEAQFLRVAQAFSQTSLISPRVMSNLFPGALYSEHGSFTMKATEQADGSIVVDISGDPRHPLQMREQFVIRPDGSHTCTVFEMRRPALNGRQAQAQA